MNILIDLRLLSKGKTSGIEEYTRLLVDALLAHDAKNTYTFFYNGWKKISLPERWLKQKNVHAVVTRIPNKLLDFSLRAFGVPEISSFAEVDVVFSPHFNLLRTGKTPHFITFHDLSFLHFPEFYPLRKRIWHWLQDYRNEAFRAARLIAVSEFTKMDLVERFGIDEEKIEVLYPAPDPFYSARETGGKELIMFAETHRLNVPFLLSVGVLEPRKNVPAIIRAFNLLKQKPMHEDLKLVIVGERGWSYDEIFREAHASPWSRQILFWGRASRENLRILYTLASVFVYPSFFEGFGFPPLEAQACGVPVVASNRASLPEILGSSALLADPWNIDELVFGIHSLLADESLRNEFRKRGFENVKRFSWERAVPRYLELFSDE